MHVNLHHSNQIIWNYWVGSCGNIWATAIKHLSLFWCTFLRPNWGYKLSNTISGCRSEVLPFGWWIFLFERAHFYACVTFWMPTFVVIVRMKCLGMLCNQSEHCCSWRAHAALKIITIESSDILSYFYPLSNKTRLPEYLVMSLDHFSCLRLRV